MSTTPNVPTSEQPSPDTTIGELRQTHGAHFAAGYGDQDKLGQVLARAGVSTLQEYLAQGKHL